MQDIYYSSVQKIHQKEMFKFNVTVTILQCKIHPKVAKHTLSLHV